MIKKSPKFCEDKGNLIPVKNLQLHVSHSCNLACESCSHYSNHNIKGNLSLYQAEEWMSLWNNRILPKRIDLLGGEPTINPLLSDITLLTREKFETTKITVFTNGFFLHKHPNLPIVLKEVGNSKIVLSIHHYSKEYLDAVIANIILLKNWSSIYNLETEIRPSAKMWTRRYKGYGSTMEPYEDNNPRESWESCIAKYCTQLYEGKLWKCPPLAYLKLQKEKFDLSPKWDTYLNYKPLSPDCTREELITFTKEEEIPACSMCAANPEQFELPNPLIRPKN